MKKLYQNFGLFYLPRKQSFQMKNDRTIAGEHIRRQLSW